jgi:hypothetical protein
MELSDITLVGSEKTVLQANLFTHLTSKLREYKPFYRFRPSPLLQSELYKIDKDGTRIEDFTQGWITCPTDCLVYWGSVVYFEIFVESTKTNRFFMLGVCPESKIPTDMCIYEYRFYPGDSAEFLNVVGNKSRVGLLIDTINSETILYLNGNRVKTLHRLDNWENKTEPMCIVVCMALGSNILRIENEHCYVGAVNL